MSNMNWLRAPLLRWSLLALFLAGGGAWFQIVRVRREVFRADVSAVCVSEARAETTMVSSRVLVEDAAGKTVRGDEGRVLFERLRAARPGDAAEALRAAVAKAKVVSCPAISGYEALARHLALQRSADVLCRSLNPVLLIKTPPAARFLRLTEWAHENVHDPALDQMLVRIAGRVPGEIDARMPARMPAQVPGRMPGLKSNLPLAEATAGLRAALSDLDIHSCGMLAGLASPLAAVPGSNVMVKSVVLQSDTREKAVTELVRGLVPALRGCYDVGLAKNAALEGTLNLKFRMTDKGQVDLVTVQPDSTVNAPEVLSCAAIELKTLKGPPGGVGASAGGVLLDLFVAK